MRFEQAVATIVISLLAGTAGAFAILAGHIPNAANAGRAPTAMDRVHKTGQLRCGYVEFAQFFSKDAKTGALSGIWYELTEKIAALAHIKIAWVPTTYATVVTELKARKFDAMCSDLWETSARASELLFSQPVYYSGLGIFVRAEETRFTGNPEELNSPEVKFAVQDGEMSQIVQQSDFPRGGVLALPNTVEPVQLAESVASHKADAVIAQQILVDNYQKSNPGKLKALPLSRPLRVFGDSYATLPEDHALRDFLSAGVRELQSSGFVEQTLRKYELAPGEFFRAALPYAVNGVIGK